MGDMDVPTRPASVGRVRGLGALSSVVVRPLAHASDPLRQPRELRASKMGCFFGLTQRVPNVPFWFPDLTIV